MGINPRGVAVNSNTNRIYIANYLSSTVTVINGETNTVIETINVNAAPYDLVVNP
ncbi:hypothetical protein D3C71_2056170 [compost metagenome]